MLSGLRRRDVNKKLHNDLFSLSLERTTFGGEKSVYTGVHISYCRLKLRFNGVWIEPIFDEFSPLQGFSWGDDGKKRIELMLIQRDYSYVDASRLAATFIYAMDVAGAAAKIHSLMKDRPRLAAELREDLAAQVAQRKVRKLQEELNHAAAEIGETSL